MHLPKPGPDNGQFLTTEVRPRTKPTSITSRAISFPRNHYTAPPNVAGGFHLLDLSHKAPAVRANLVGSDITKEGFVVGIETWDRGVLYQAGATWIEHKRGGRECGFGQFDTRDVASESVEEGEVKITNGHAKVPRKLRINGRKDSLDTNGIDSSYEIDYQHKQRQSFSKRIKFPSKLRGGKQPPEVVCWLNRLDLQNWKGRGHRLHAFAGDVTTESATFTLETWGDSVLNGAAMCYIAFPKGKRKVDSGYFSTHDVEDEDEEGGQVGRRGKEIRNRVEFREGWFTKPPTILCALSMFDLGGEADLKIKVEALDVDKDGFTWCLSTWDDSILHAAGASWIALGFE
ncbi:hypothetical protein EG328_011103 [Venturia inaequalis]|uniref:H-type lectin domain-containing protein n=1 Tax=Venturia inaequalis TaxID=5025 RepID=A0A8H3V6S8_VENIN|nr:hypothetical protein EG328_011103 [Venturia inaequalis]